MGATPLPREAGRPAIRQLRFEEDENDDPPNEIVKQKSVRSQRREYVSDTSVTASLVLAARAPSMLKKAGGAGISSV